MLPKETSLEVDFDVHINPQNAIDNLIKFWFEYGNKNTFAVTLNFESPQSLTDFIAKQNNYGALFSKLSAYKLALHWIEYTSYSYEDIQSDTVNYAHWNKSRQFLEAIDRNWSFPQPSPQISKAGEPVDGYSPYIILQDTKPVELAKTGCGLNVTFDGIHEECFTLPLAGIIGATYVKDVKTLR